MDAADREHRAELLQLIKGSPEPQLGPDAMAQRLGVTPGKLDELLGHLERSGHVVRHEDGRLIVVEHD
jgi:DNA-binding IclR family transcriptional regulator